MPVCFQKGTENTMISAAFPYHKKRIPVLGLEMAYVDEGQGDPGRTQPSQHALCSRWPAQSTVIVKGVHNLQEDSPDEVRHAVASWLQTLAQRARESSPPQGGRHEQASHE